MACLVDVFHFEQRPPLLRRQLPLMIEDQLMMVMDLNNLDLLREHVLVKNKEIEEFMKKYRTLTEFELTVAFEITLRDILNILSESVPCVGCRRSVERLYSQLMDVGELTLDPLIVKRDGTLSIKLETINNPKTICSIFAEHSRRLSNLVDSQPRSKKSRRCVLHSWDLQKTRPVTPAWRDVWKVMLDKCKAEVLLIDFSMLLSKLENYLKKHRFCAECKTKVMKAYNLLVEDCDPTKEKGFIPALYSKIKKCSDKKCIHLPTETAYIDSLIARAEPELMGNRRERHAKTMEIAQEEVLTCVGICIYDRLHRIYLRLREEEFTCRVLAAVAVEALCRSFETSVENKRGVTQLELLYFELTKEELARQQKKDSKKLRKKRKKKKFDQQERKGSCEFESDEFLDHPDEDEEDDDSCCDCREEKSSADGDRHKLRILDRKNKGIRKCSCEDCNSETKMRATGKSKQNTNNNTVVDVVEDRNNKCKSCQSEQLKSKKKNKQQQQHDCGYSSENNNTSCDTGSSCTSTPDGSEVACSDGFCDHEAGECGERQYVDSKISNTNHQSPRFSLILEKMLDNTMTSGDEDCYIPAEEIRAFKARIRQVDEKRNELRQTLRNRFAQLCVRSKSVRSNLD